MTVDEMIASDTQPRRDSATESEIRAVCQPHCMLCGSAGRLIYRNQRDRLFSAPGTWTFKKCPNHECGLIWLDPMPVEEDLGKAYTKYYTHQTQGAEKRPGTLKCLFGLMQRGYWAGKYGYPTAGSLLPKWWGKLLYLFPLRRNEADGEVRHLSAVPNGRLLDVGCGAGGWLSLMHSLGWRVEGIDFDEHAVEIAAQNGLNVRLGGLEQQAYPSESFDAVVLNHVIEHLPDPVGTLAECFRVLRPGGKLVLFTPNSLSLGHVLFRDNWRGLEPPRHLHVFSMQTLPQTLAKAGFHKISAHPQIGRSVISQSFLLFCRRIGFNWATRQKLFPDVIARCFTALEVCLLNWRPSISDCVGAVATK